MKKFLCLFLIFILHTTAKADETTKEEALADKNMTNELTFSCMNAITKRGVLYSILDSVYKQTNLDFKFVALSQKMSDEDFNNCVDGLANAKTQMDKMYVNHVNFQIKIYYDVYGITPVKNWDGIEIDYNNGDYDIMMKKTKEWRDGMFLSASYGDACEINYWQAEIYLMNVSNILSKYALPQIGGNQ